MKKNYTLLLFAAGAFIFLFACKSNPEKKQHEYYYYPKTNMYFDVARGNYLFSLDGGNTWDSIDSKTQNEPVTLGDKEVIYSTSDSIWTDNEVHRQQYGGLLYDVLSGDSTDSPANEIVTDKKIVKKIIIEKPVVEEKQKKGLGKFLSKIFGKKNKRDKNKTEE